ncbi:MAG: hypothetical protein QMA98_05740, partial [Pseudomonadales bacterium]
GASHNKLTSSHCGVAGTIRRLQESLFVTQRTPGSMACAALVPASQNPHLDCGGTIGFLASGYLGLTKR